jgi:putative glutathione S-transferase
MGHLLNGTWVRTPLVRNGGDGSFQRADSLFRNWITPEGTPGPSGEGGFRAESGRYHLYVSYACPWAHRTLILRSLKGLAPHVGVSVVHPDMLDDGWSFATGFPGTTGDSLHGLPFLRDLYTRARPDVTARVTVPVLWDRARDTIVSNESAEILRMFNAAFDGLTGNDADFFPAPLRDGIEAWNAEIYDRVNNGVYKAGFATTQAAYGAAVGPLFRTLDRIDRHLARNRWLMGDTLTEADLRLFPTLVRFDTVYHGHFKCNRRRLVDYPNLWPYTRALYQLPGIAGTVHLDHITRHYHYSHDSINPHRIVPIGPDIDFTAPHGR